MTSADRSLLASVTAALTRAGLQANIPTGRQKRPGFGARCFERGAVSVFDYFADGGATFARACAALVAAGFAVTDCSPARGSDFVCFGAARVTRAA